MPESNVESNCALSNDNEIRDQIKIMLRYLPASINKENFISVLNSIDVSIKFMRLIPIHQVFNKYSSAVLLIPSSKDITTLIEKIRNSAISGNLTGKSQMIFID